MSESVRHGGLVFYWEIAWATTQSWSEGRYQNFGGAAGAATVLVQQSGFCSCAAQVQFELGGCDAVRGQWRTVALLQMLLPLLILRLPLMLLLLVDVGGAASVTVAAVSVMNVVVAVDDVVGDDD